LDIEGQLKLFRYYFFTEWSDKNRARLMDKTELRHNLISNAEHLFEKIDATGIILEDFGAKTFYLTFTH